MRAVPQPAGLQRSTHVITPRPLAIVLAAATIAVASSGLALTRTTEAPPANVELPATADLPPDAPAAEPRPLDELDGAIAAWSANLAAEPADFIAAVNLAELYLARTRISGDGADIERASEAAGRALAVDPSLAAGRLLRAQAAHAAHDFEAAEADALAVLESVPDAPEALAVLGDARLELGAYDTAGATYTRLAELAAGPAVDARLARLAAATGRLTDARELGAAATSAAVAAAASPTSLAWYHGLEAALAFQAGDVPGAIAAWQASLDEWDRSAAAHAGIGRAQAADGDLQAAMASLERATAIHPLPDALALLAAIQERLGDAEAAAATRATFLATVELTEGDRALSRFLADRGEDPARAVSLARADLAIRRDPYAHDTLAWALLAAGRATEADAEMQLALAAGTEDAMLDYHAGMIAAALGRDDDARRLLTAALERNPGFDLVQAERARQALEELGGSASR